MIVICRKPVTVRPLPKKVISLRIRECKKVMPKGLGGPWILGIPYRRDDLSDGFFSADRPRERLLLSRNRDPD